MVKKILVGAGIILLGYVSCFGWPYTGLVDEGNNLLDINSDGSLSVTFTTGDAMTMNSISVSTITVKDAGSLRLNGTGTGIVISTATAVNTITLAAGGALTSLGSITATGSFIIGSADMSEVDLEKLDGITNGTAAAAKALVADNNIDIASLRNVTATGTMQAALVTVTGGKYGTTDSRGNLIYELIVSTSLKSTEEFTLSPADGKAGGFDIIAGTHTARGSFTSAAAVTLTSDGSGTATTTNGGSDTLNVYDGGTSVVVENGAGPTYTVYIRYWYVN